MKKILPLLSFIFLTALLVTSCKKDDDGDDRDQYVGTYSVSETFTLVGGGTGTDTYTITVSKSSTKSQVILISNFANINETAEATVSGNTIVINTQSLTDSYGDIYGLSGSGSISGNTLNISYTITSSWSGTCVCTKL